MLYYSPAGLVVVSALPGRRHRIVATVDEAPESPGRDFVQALLDARGPQQQPARVRDVVWSSRFRVHHRWPSITARAGSSWPATPRMCTAQRVGRA